MLSHSPYHSSPFKIGRILGILIIGIGVLQVLSLMNYYVPPISEEIVMWGTAGGALIGGINLLIARHGMHGGLFR